MDDEDELVELSVAPAPSIQKELQNLFPGLEGTLFPPCTDLQLLAAEAGDQLLDLDKSKNRVFLMARQYSQKIKKANQLLKMKSMDVEPSCMRSSPSSSSRSKQKDLADILEEKKQGGAAIGEILGTGSGWYTTNHTYEHCRCCMQAFGIAQPWAPPSWACISDISPICYSRIRHNP